MKYISLEQLTADEVSRSGVVCVPHASPPTANQLVAIALRIGRPVPFGLGKYQRDDLPREITVLDNQGDGVTSAPRSFGEGWHQDSSFLTRAPAFTMLAALDVPTTGGDTLFADTRRAIAGASDHYLAELGQISLKHSVGPTYRIAPKDVGKSLQKLVDELPNATHPLLYEHPVAGPTLLISPLYAAPHVAGAVKAFFDELLARIIGDAFSHRWSVGDIVVWDNRVVLHSAPGYSGPERRRLMRVVIEEIARQ